MFESLTEAGLEWLEGQCLVLREVKFLPRLGCLTVFIIFQIRFCPAMFLLYWQDCALLMAEAH